MSFNPLELREICWEIGTYFPPYLHGDFISFLLVHPRQALLQWNIEKSIVDSLRSTYEGGEEESIVTIRVYDVTDVIFDGSNAHSTFDIEVKALSGNYYLALWMQNRNLIAEIGLRFRSGCFRPICRSNLLIVDRDQRSGTFSTSGLFVGTGFGRVFPVENVFEYAVLAPLNRLLSIHCKATRVAVVSVSLEQTWPVDQYITQVMERARLFDITGWVVRAGPAASDAALNEYSLLRRVKAYSVWAFERLFEVHAQHSISVVHCHDWYSWLPGRALQQRNDVPLLMTVRSTEIQRTNGKLTSSLSQAIYQWERQAVHTANKVVVATEETRSILIQYYGIDASVVSLIRGAIPYDENDRRTQTFEKNSVLQSLNLSENAVVVLYCGEVSHANGADLLMSAIPRVCAEHPTVQFVFIGEGPLKAELEAQAFCNNIGDRCRFCGNVSTQVFDVLFERCDIVVIPARTWQDESLARRAIEKGRPVLTTHQAHISCVLHGRTGLITYDNPGSIEWGLKELLFKKGFIRSEAPTAYMESASTTAIAAQYAVLYHELALQVGIFHA